MENIDSLFAIRNSQKGRSAKLAAKKKNRGGACLFVFAKPRKTFGGETPTDAMLICRANGRGRASSLRRTTVGVPPRLLPKGLSSPKAQRQARLPGMRQERSVRYARPNRGAKILRS